MNLLYPNLLTDGMSLEGIIKLLIERIAFGDAPFLSEITDNIYKVDSNLIDLRMANTHTMAAFLRQNFDIYSPSFQWKTIRKTSIRNILLNEYIKKVHAPSHIQLLTMHLAFSKKIISNESVIMNETFSVKSI